MLADSSRECVNDLVFVVISAVAGLILSPHAANFIRPLEYAQNSTQNLNAITLYFTRLVLGVQLVLAGIQLPSKYLKVEWRSLSMLLGPVMLTMWMVTSLIMWALIPNISILQALAVGACVTPTDPILSNSIVKGKFADKNIPDELQKIIIAESGTNDGLVRRNFAVLSLPSLFNRRAIPSFSWPSICSNTLAMGAQARLEVPPEPWERSLPLPSGTRS